MKTKLLYLLLFVTAIASAQIVNIPDANFKARLLAAGTNIDIAKNSLGQNITIDTNSDGEIQQSEALLVYELRVNNRSITNIEGIQSFTNLTFLNCGLNSLTSLEVRTCINLHELNAGFNQLTSINLSNMVNLEIIDLRYNQLTQINVSGCTSLSDFSFYANRLTDIDLNGLTALRGLFCSGNYLTNIDLTGINLSSLSCGSNNIAILDLTSQTNLNLLSCMDSPNLLEAYITNGPAQPVNSETFYNCTSLNIICTDEDEIDDVLSELQFSNISLEGLTVTSVCAAPASDYNTITGTVTFDLDNDGCDAEDTVRSLLKVKLNDGVNTGYSFTNRAGEYTFHTQAGTFDVTPQFEDIQYFIASPTTAQVVFPVVDNSVATENFCISADGIHPDVEVVMVPIGNARPGFDANYKIVYKNKGNQTLSGTLSCVWDYNVLEAVSITPMASDIQPGNYSWNFTDLQPFENREILMTLNVNSPTENPAVNSGDILPFTAVVTDTGADETPEDNEFTLNQRVVNSYDPNNIICIEGDSQPTNRIGKYLHYVVNFENTGTADAIFINVIQDINVNEFDINTLEILNASHDVTATVMGNTIQFGFRNINLASAAHGNILFKLKSRPNLLEGDQVTNQARIVFDFNEAIVTNEASTVFSTLGMGEFDNTASVKIYPNPSTGIVNIKSAGAIQSVQLYDVQGRLLQVANSSSFIDISARANGIYVLKVTTDKGTKVEKLIKQ